MAAAQDEDLDSTEYVLGKNWRDFIPVIKVRIIIMSFYFKNNNMFYV